jgi:DNA-binding MarR family transcriptional regulator
MKDITDIRLDQVLARKHVERRVLLRRLLKELPPPGDTAGKGGAKKPTPFTPEQYEIVLILDTYGHGVTVKEIVEAVDAPHANITRTLERLENKGLIYRTHGAEDRRQMIVRLTLAGAKTARQMAKIAERLDDQLWHKLTDDEKRTLLRLLRKA